MPGPRVADTADSPERLAALRSYGILDTPRESDFDDLSNWRPGYAALPYQSST
ncbi:hypothetical protein V2J83_14425 [Pseudomonas alliivorans]|nr:hypothetical protein [Pseudomonas alliivorans]